MTREDLRIDLEATRTVAAICLRAYARRRCSHVDAGEVQALAGALGEISFDEACDALDRLELAAAAAERKE